MPKPKEPTDKNSKLMRDCGAKPPYGWDPEPPDQWRYQMNHGDAMSRIVGWVKSKTTHRSRSPFAVDEHKKALTLKHMAIDLGWKPKTAWNLAIEAEAEGLIRIEKNAKKEPGRIYLCADIPKAGRRKGELHSFVQRSYPPYLIEQIDRMSEIQRHKFYASYEAFWKWSKEAMGDGVAELRSYIEQAEDSTLQAFGLEKKREVKRRVKKTKVRVELPEVPDFVQSAQTEVCTKPESRTVQRKIEAHIKESDTDSRTTATQQPQWDAQTFPLTDAAITKNFPAADDDCRGRIVRAALAIAPDRVNDRSIAQAIVEATTKTQRSAALYVRTVPTVIGAWLRDADRRKTA